jgi:hypothetical protein
MEDDCDDFKSPATKNDADQENQDNILKMLGAISHQMMENLQRIQDHLVHTEENLTQKLECAIQDLEAFKREVNDKFSQFGPPSSTNCALSSSQPSVAMNSTPVGLSSSASCTLLPSTMLTTTASSQLDYQNQKMVLLNDTFSKLSTALVENKTTDSKSEWPKFLGDSKKFRSWYLAIKAQLSIPPWAELYDSTMNTVISTTSNTVLNGKLSAKLLVSLEGQAFQHMTSRQHLHANGLLLMKELQQMYKPRNVPEIIAAKTGEFWSQTKRSTHETVTIIIP